MDGFCIPEHFKPESLDIGVVPFLTSYPYLAGLRLILCRRRWSRKTLIILPFLMCPVFYILLRNVLLKLHVQEPRPAIQQRSELSKKDYNKIRGIPNIGNTCFMNAVIQVLCRTPYFRKQLRQAMERRKEKGTRLQPQQSSNRLTQLSTSPATLIRWLITLMPSFLYKEPPLHSHQSSNRLAHLLTFLATLVRWPIGQLMRVPPALMFKLVYKEPPTKLDERLLELMEAVLMGSPVSSSLPKAVLDSVSKIDEKFMGHKQQDSYEFLNKVIGELEDLYQQENSAVDDNGSDGDTWMTREPILRLFGGVFCTVYIYNTCEHVEPVFQRFTTIPVQVLSQSRHTKPEISTLEEVDENQTKTLPQKTSTQKQEAGNKTEVSTQKQEAGNKTEVSTQEEEAGNKTEVSTQKQEAGNKTEVSTQEEEAGNKSEVSTQEEEAGNKTEVSTQKQEAGNKTEVSTQKQEAGNKTEVSIQKQESGNKTEVSTQKQEAGNKTEVSTQEQEAGNKSEVSTQEQEAGNKTEVSTQKQEAGNKSKVSTQEEEAGNKTEVSTQEEEIDSKNNVSPPVMEPDNHNDVSSPVKEADNNNGVLPPVKEPDNHNNVSLPVKEPDNRYSVSPPVKEPDNHNSVSPQNEEDNNHNMLSKNEAANQVKVQMENDPETSRGDKITELSEPSCHDNTDNNPLEQGSSNQSDTSCRQHGNFCCLFSLNNESQDQTDLHTGLRLWTDVNKTEGLSCRICNNKDQITNSWSRILFVALPPVLVFQFNRFQMNFDGSLKKIGRQLSFPEYFDAAPYCSSAMKVLNNESGSDLDLTYRLYGVVCHMGSIQGGHYTAHVRMTVHQEEKMEERFLSKRWRDPESSVNEIFEFWEIMKTKQNETQLEGNNATNLPTETEKKNGDWYTVNDSRVTKCTLETVLSEPNAYILMYERVLRPCTRPQ